MKEDIEIDIQDSNINETEESVQLPMNLLLFGELENDDIKVYIKQDVYKALEKYAEADTTKEVGTILLGQYCEELGKMHVVISNYIEAKYTDASAATLTFTHETWDYVYKEYEKNYKDTKIIGWQHTHPNYGIFLSNYDLFIHENFFNLPFQIAYVIDPIQNIRGFFQWKDGKIQKLKGYYIYDDVDKPIKIEQKKIKKEENKTISTGSKNSIRIVMTMLTVVIVILSIITIQIVNKYEEQRSNQEMMKELMDRQTQKILDIQEQHKPEKNNTPEVEGTIKFISYKVTSGDTLSKICSKNKIDYQTNSNIILSINGITNPDYIRPGQTILLPISQ